MIDNRNVEITDRICAALLSILPPQAAKIHAMGKAADDWVEVGFEFEDDRGERGAFSFRDHPARVAGDIGQDLAKLRRLMMEKGARPWSRCKFTVSRAGRFNARFDYES